MSITVIYSGEESKHSFSITRLAFFLACILIIAILIASAWLLQTYYYQKIAQHKVISLTARNLTKQQYLQFMQSHANEQYRVLTEKIRELQVQSKSLNALGERIVEKSDLPKEEFKVKINQDISLDSACQPVISAQINFNILNESFEQLSKNLLNNKNQLQQLEIALNNLHLNNELYISGRPVSNKDAWISSPFGIRSDPFTGRLRLHKGIDIAGYTGMPIIAVAAGIVTASGKRSGYGFVIEINHGRGLITRYAHAKSLIVSIGAFVKKGQVIAVMGNTGRSTGPHVHYEVIKNGRQVDPNYYINRLPS